ncbi:MAG: HAMP domain-containing sensor histidine kinase [Cyanobacteriota bacterium]|nr:HAMP domain-containing sensor histidine kinase [Cyanobacteriota bacterium]
MAMRDQRSLPSLRLWLQSTTLLAVIAGYALLLGVNRSLNQAQRLEDHRQLVAALRSSASALDQLQRADAAFGLIALLEPAGAEQAPLSRQLGGRTWLESRTLLQGSDDLSRTLVVRQDITESLQRQQQFQLLLIASAGSSLMLTALLLRFVLWRGLVLPLQHLNRQVSQLKADTLAQTFLEPGEQPRELQPLAVAFNELQRRLADAWHQERSFVDGVAHELRTPISVISAHAQQWQQIAASKSHGPAALIASETARMGQLLQVLLELARSDNGRLQLVMKLHDPEDALLMAYERLRSLAADRLQLAMPSQTALPLIQVDQDRLQQCLASLIDNAMAYGVGPILLWAESIGGHVVLHVQDHGPGIPEPERFKVVQRFQRGSTASGTRGSGLGLALVQQLVVLMSGELRIADAAGGGADLQLWFRASDLPPEP